MLGDQRAPDLIEPVIGWRYWDATHPDEEGWNDELIEPLLVSPYQTTFWDGGIHTWDGTCGCGADERTRRGLTRLQRLVQSLRRLPLVRRLWPVAASDWLGCHCGVNAWRTRELALERVEVGTTCDAFGSVALSGRVVQFATGWRAEQARIERVWATSDDVAERVALAATAAGVRYEGVLCHAELPLHRELLISIALRTGPFWLLVGALLLADVGTGWSCAWLGAGMELQLAAWHTSRSSWRWHFERHTALWMLRVMSVMALGELLLLVHATIPMLIA
jgi:hypothetical protein